MESNVIKPGGPVLRLRLRWSKGELSIEKIIRLESKTLPHHREIPKMKVGFTISGAWFEVATEEGDVLYRGLLKDPFRQSVEIWSDKGKPYRVDTYNENVQIDITIPDNPKAKQLSLFVNPPPFVKYNQDYNQQIKPIASLLL